MRISHIFLVLCSLLLIYACASDPSPGPEKVSYLVQEKLEASEKNLTLKQVKDVVPGERNPFYFAIRNNLGYDACFYLDWECWNCTGEGYVDTFDTIDISAGDSKAIYGEIAATGLSPGTYGTDLRVTAERKDGECLGRSPKSYASGSLVIHVV